MEARREVDDLILGPHWVTMGYTVYPPCYIYIYYIHKHGPGISPLRKMGLYGLYMDYKPPTKWDAHLIRIVCG